MRKVILYIAESLDGFVATKDQGVAWLDKYNDPKINYGWDDFMKRIDTVVQGNTTYQQFKPKYEDKASFVFTKHPEKYSEEDVVFTKESPDNFIKNLDENKHQNIWLVGGPTLLAEFLKHKLVDECIIFVMPIVLGEGIPLFQKLKTQPTMSLIDSKKYDNGVVELRYNVEK